MAYAISLETVQSVAKVLKKDIMIAPAMLKQDMLGEIGVNVITGVENVESEFIPLTFGGAIRAYDPAKTYTDDDSKEVAQVLERQLKVYTAYRPATLNLQSFKEKEPWDSTDKVDEESLKRLPQTTYTIMQAGELYGQEVVNAFIAGDVAHGKNHPLGIYNGVRKLIELDMATQEIDGVSVPVLISEEQGNLIKTEPIVRPASTTDFSAYTTFSTFVEKLNPALRMNPDGCYIVMDMNRALWIFEAYMNRFPNLQSQVKFDKGFEFFGHHGVRVIGSPLMGVTDMMFATRPGNIDFAIASEKDTNSVSVRQIGIDPNKLNMWIQSAQGARIKNPTAEYFAVNAKTTDGKLYEIKPYNFGFKQIASTSDLD